MSTGEVRPGVANAAPGDPPRIGFARHGEATWTGTRYAGHSDIPLTGAGRAGAAALAIEIVASGLLADPASVIVASPLQRAHETAKAVAALAGRPIEIDPRWAEVRFGALEGLTFEEASAAYPAVVARMAARDIAIDWPEGETWGAFSGRIGAALEAVLARGVPVLVVSHGIAIRAALGVLLAHRPGDATDLPYVHPSTAILLRNEGAGWALEDAAVRGVGRA